MKPHCHSYILRLVSLTFFALACSTLYAKEKMSYSGYSGGMMVHSGYVFGGESTPLSQGVAVSEAIPMSGFPIGLGGAVRFCFGDYLRIGTEGYSSTLSYNKNASYSRIGWGGLLADCAFRFKEKHLLYVGLTVGGGSCKNLTLMHDTEADWEVEENTSYRKYAFMALDPFVGYEYALTSRIHLIFKLDYLFNVSNPQPDFCTGPRLYVGFMFCREPHKG